MTETLFTVRNLKLFNRLNKCIKQGITDLHSKDRESAENFLKMGIKTANQLSKIAEELFQPYFNKIAEGIGAYLENGEEDLLVSTNPNSVHSQLWTVHKKLCDTFNITYVEDVDEMDAVIEKLKEEGRIQ